MYAVSENSDPSNHALREKRELPRLIKTHTTKIESTGIDVSIFAFQWHRVLWGQKGGSTPWHWRCLFANLVHLFSHTCFTWSCLCICIELQVTSPEPITKINGWIGHSSLNVLLKIKGLQLVKRMFGKGYALLTLEQRVAKRKKYCHCMWALLISGHAAS